MAEGRWRKAVERSPRFAPALRWVENEVDVPEQLKRVSENILSRLSMFVSDSLYALAGILITLFLLFYFFRDKRQARGAV